MPLLNVINKTCNDIPHELGSIKKLYFDKIVFPIRHLNVYASNILWPTS